MVSSARCNPRSVDCGLRRLLPLITRSASFLVVVASHDARRSGWRIRLACSARRSQTVCTTSSVAAEESRYERATDQTRPANRSTTSSHARSSPSMTRRSSSCASTGREPTSGRLPPMTTILTSTGAGARVPDTDVTEKVRYQSPAAWISMQLPFMMRPAKALERRPCRTGPSTPERRDQASITHR